MSAPELSGEARHSAGFGGEKHIVMPQATQEEIQKWKNQYGEIFEVHVDGHFGYLKRPDRKVIGYAASVANNPIRSNEIMLNGCWVGGDEVIKTRDDLFLSVQSVLQGLLEVKQAELVKL